MKTLILAVLVFVAACGGNPWIPAPHPQAIGESQAKVTGKLDCPTWKDYRCASYFKLEDDQFQIGIHLLLSYERACLVSNEDATMVKVQDDYLCNWRWPRRF